MKYLLFSGILLASSLLSLSQTAQFKNLTGTYQFLNDDSLLRLTIVLKGDHTFVYDRVNDLIEKKSEGTWNYSRDTLLLNTYDQINHFKINVKESERTGNVIKFGDIRTRNGHLLPTALVSINGDSTKLYDPLGANYTLNCGDVRSFSLIVGRTRSEIYAIKDIRASKIDIRLDMDQSPIDYYFMQNAKFLVVGSKIVLIDDNRVDSVTISMKNRIPAFLMKIK
jgi:hypothetical protein